MRKRGEWLTPPEEGKRLRLDALRLVIIDQSKKVDSPAALDRVSEATPKGDPETSAEERG